MKRVCKNCRYFDPFWDETPDGKPVMHEGSCNRYPPVYTGPSVHHDDFREIENLISCHCWNSPQVGCMHSCGEWKKVKHAEPES